MCLLAHLRVRSEDAPPNAGRVIPIGQAAPERPLFELDACGLAEAIRDRDVSPVEVVDATFLRISALDREVNSCVVLLEEEARQEARRAESAVLARNETGALHGVPVTIKETIPVAGTPATFGCPSLRDAISPADAVVVERLRDAGAIIVAKTNVPEMSWWVNAENPVYGQTKNPWDLRRGPGGSSGGAGAGVAAGITPLAIGMDGGGSIRIPASFCGVAGIKPTFGLVPKGRGFGGLDSLSVIGPLARTIRDLALSLDIVAGPHPTDETSLPPLGIHYVQALMNAVDTSLRIAFTTDFGFARVDPVVRRLFLSAVERARSVGWFLEEARPDTGDPTEFGLVIAAHEWLPYGREHVRRAKEELTAETVHLYLGRPQPSAADYVAALEDRSRYARAWGDFFAKHDLLLTPTAPVTAVPLGATGPQAIDGRAVDPAGEGWFAPFTYPANLTGQPAASVPCGFDDEGHPVGLQIVGRRGEDHVVLGFAAAWTALWPDAVQWPAWLRHPTPAAKG